MSARITINGVAGSNANLPLNVLTQLNNQNTGGEVTFLWSIVSQPAGPTDSLSATNIQNPTFTPKKEGTYLIQLTVNAGAAGEATDRQIAGILDLKTGQRIPAAQETVQTSATLGWSQAVDPLLQETLDRMSRNGGIVTGQALANLTYGTVVGLELVVNIKVSLPGQEKVPGIGALLANQTTNMRLPAGVLLGPVGSDGSNATTNQLVDVLLLGLFTGAPYSLGTWSVGAGVYVSDTGTLVRTPGTGVKRIGTVLTVSTASGFDVPDFWIDGFAVTPQVLMRYQGTVPAIGTALWAESVPSVTHIPRGLGGTRAYCGTPPATGQTATLTLLNGALVAGTITFADTGVATLVLATGATLTAGTVLSLKATTDPHGLSDVTVALVTE